MWQWRDAISLASPRWWLGRFSSCGEFSTSGTFIQLICLALFKMGKKTFKTSSVLLKDTCGLWMKTGDGNCDDVHTNLEVKWVCSDNCDDVADRQIDAVKDCQYMLHQYTRVARFETVSFAPNRSDIPQGEFEVSSIVVLWYRWESVESAMDVFKLMAAFLSGIVCFVSCAVCWCLSCVAFCVDFASGEEPPDPATFVMPFSEDALRGQSAMTMQQLDPRDTLRGQSALKLQQLEPRDTLRGQSAMMMQQLDPRDTLRGQSAMMMQQLDPTSSHPTSSHTLKPYQQPYQQKMQQSFEHQT